MVAGGLDLLRRADTYLEAFLRGDTEQTEPDCEALLEVAQTLPAGNHRLRLKVFYTVGWLSWCRHLYRSDGTAWDDGLRALSCFAEVARWEPHLVPTQLSPVPVATRENPTGTEPAESLAQEPYRLGYDALPAARRAAIKLFVYSASHGGAHQARDLASAAALHGQAYEADGNPEDLRRALRYASRALAASAGHRDEHRWLYTLAVIHIRAFLTDRDPAHLAECILAARRAVARAPAVHQGMSAYRLFLAQALALLPLWGAGTVDVDEVHQEALEEADASIRAATGGPNRRAAVLGVCVLLRQMMGGADDLTILIRLGESLLPEAGPEGDLIAYHVFRAHERLLADGAPGGSRDGMLTAGERALDSKTYPRLSGSDRWKDLSRFWEGYEQRFYEKT